MENVVLAAIQSQWLRAHNRFAFQLSQWRPDWGMNDDLLYEESRKLMMALHQHYVYELWLPILLGTEATEKYISHDGLFSRYDPQVNLSMDEDERIILCPSLGAWRCLQWCGGRCLAYAYICARCDHPLSTWWRIHRSSSIERRSRQSSTCLRVRTVSSCRLFHFPVVSTFQYSEQWSRRLPLRCFTRLQLYVRRKLRWTDASSSLRNDQQTGSNHSSRYHRHEHLSRTWTRYSRLQCLPWTV